MKIAPKSLLILILCLSFCSGCRYRSDDSGSPESSPPIESPAERSKDSSQQIKSNDRTLPEVRFPKNRNKKADVDLDTLRPIKA